MELLTTIDEWRRTEARTKNTRKKYKRRVRAEMISCIVLVTTTKKERPKGE